jgi:hypothetical protein
MGVLAQEWQQAKTIWTMLSGTIVSRAREVELSDGCLMHVCHLGQIDPELVMSVIEKLRMRFR